MAGVSLASRLGNNAYADVPCAYVVLDRDAVLPKEFQEMMVALQNDKTGSFVISNCPTGRPLHLGWTEGGGEHRAGLHQHDWSLIILRLRQGRLDEDQRYATTYSRQECSRINQRIHYRIHYSNTENERLLPGRSSDRRKDFSPMAE